ncbi:MAG TPA: thiamine pyrophosphate-binding protein, partial [Bacillota bacterium]
MTETTTVEAIADEIARAGVDRVFGLPGGEVLFLLDALRRRGVEFVLCRHEAAAGLAAAVYGKLRRVPGVVLTTLGPGAANLMLPLANSLLDREPLLAISASLPAGLPVTHTHQRLPLLDVYRPVTKLCAEISPFGARRTVRRALAAALEEPAGPAFLTLSPRDGQAPAYDRTEPAEADAPSGGRAPSPAPGDPDKAAAELSRALGRATKPLVLLGLGVRPERAPALRRWLEAWRLPVAVTPKVKGLVDETGDGFVGVVGGMAVDGLMMDALTQADLIIGFGFDPVEVDKAWHAGLPITWVLESASAGGHLPADHLLVADHGALLERLAAAPPPA